MTESDENIKQVDVRTKWPHEAHDFTCWLAEEENLNLLGDELGLTLKFVAREKQVGPMYLDILAREADTGGLVAIENQLEESDLGHLGQLLTYATGLDAHVGIWVAPAFYHEFAQALHKLNQWTREGIRFYGVKIELVSEDGGEPEPRFRTVVRPGEWRTDRTLPPYAKSAAWHQHDDFFRPLITELIPDFADKAVQRFWYADRFFPSRAHRAAGYGASLDGDACPSVTLYLQPWARGLTKR
ncbi:MAG: hypothetical protein OXI03_05540, partial [Chloroflexota bacterium]|nr:hypothetical protein [Chloroflexota bacterium]